MSPQVDLNLLIVLDAVLSEKSVARAAERLHLTPSAVSNSLARLRIALHDPLVVRSGRGIAPTPVAEGLARDLRPLLQELEKVIQKETFDPKSYVKQFTLAVADAGQMTRSAVLMRLLHERLPGCTLRIIGIDTYLLSGGPENLEIDVALIAKHGKTSKMQAQPLYREKSVLAVRAGHPVLDTAIDKVTLSRLEHVEVEVSLGRGFRELAEKYAQLGIERQVSLVVPNFAVAAALVAQTDFASTLPSSLLELLGESLGLVVPECPAPSVANEIVMTWHERSSEDPGHRMFRQIVASAFGSSI